ncbi:hypothetical protein JCM6882_007953 [Rhodosporidiobolus microsporus]
MSSSTQEDIFWAAAESLGRPPSICANARRDPVARRFLQHLLATNPPPGLRAPQHSFMVDGDPLEHFEQQMKAAQRQFEEERDRPLRRPPIRPRHMCILSMNAQRDAVIKDFQEDGTNSRVLTSYMGLPKTFSEKPLDKLSRINFDEMYVTQQHKDRYLLCRIVSLPILEVSVSFMVEDPSGRTEYFSVYRFPLHGVETGPDLDALFPLGQVLAVKEPLFKMNQNGINAIIRVDSPTDLVFVHPNDPLLRTICWTFPNPGKPIPSSFDYKAHGNALFKAKKYLLAVKAYTDGLASATSDEQKLLLHLNRAQAHLFLEKFASACRDSSTVLSLLDNGAEAAEQTRFKALFRRARALEGMKLLPSARDAYVEAFKVDPTSVEVKAGQQRVEKMLGEAKTGVFNWLQLEAQAVKSAKEKKLDRTNNVGDYVGPIKVVKLEARGGGRGIVATRDIKAGELLIVEKAFAVGEGPKDPNKTILMAFDLKTRNAATFEQVNLVDDVVQRMLDDPSTAPLLYSLYGGSEFPASGEATLNPLGRRPIETGKEVFVDTARIEAILVANRFGLTAIDTAKDALSTPSGLFLNTSLFNHSCAGNAAWTVMSDLMIVRSRAGIKKGEEIFIPYVSVEAPADKRKGVLRGHFGDAGCGCDLCKLDDAAGAVKLNRRRDLLEQARALNRQDLPTSVKRRKMTDQVVKMEQTYSPDRLLPLRPELVLPYHFLAEIIGHDSPAARRDANEYDLKSLEATGVVLQRSKKDIKVLNGPGVDGEMAVPLLLTIAARLAMNGLDKDNAEARLFVRAAIRMDRIIRGSDGRRFAFKWGNMVDEFNLEWMCGLELENA